MLNAAAIQLLAPLPIPCGDLGPYSISVLFLLCELVFLFTHSSHESRLFETQQLKGSSKPPASFCQSSVEKSLNASFLSG